MASVKRSKTYCKRGSPEIDKTLILALLKDSDICTVQGTQL